MELFKIEEAYIMIYGIGLPRTGSRTLAAALRILGFVGTQYCVLTGEKKFISLENHFRVDNSFYQYLDLDTTTPFNPDPTDYYIFTDRQINDWKKSIAQWNGIYNGPGIEEYKKKVIHHLELNNNFLIYNVQEGWTPLCKFLDKEIPSESFPFVV